MNTPKIDTFTVRPAILLDSEALAQIHFESYLEAYASILKSEDLSFGKSLDDRNNYRMKFLAQSDACTFVIEASGIVVGFCDIHLTAAFPENSRLSFNSSLIKSEIENLYIMRPYQNLGVGKKLFNTVLAWLQSKQLTPLILWALKDNHPARQFYEKMGGALIGERSTLIGQNYYKEVAYIFN